MRCLVSMDRFYPSPRDAGYARQIGPARRGFKPRRLEQRAHRLLLAHAVLDEQPAARQEVSRRFPDDDAHRVQPIGAGLDRELRLKLQLREVRIARRNVRGVADDSLETFSGDGFEPAAMPQLDLEVETRRIPL